MQIEWTEYEDDKARKAGRNGRKRNGQIWGSGPKHGTLWVMQLGVKDPVLVHTKTTLKGFPTHYSVREGD